MNENIDEKDNAQIFRVSAIDFKKIPGYPISYQRSNEINNAFLIGVPVSELGASRSGLQTGNNDLFLRFWFEINYTNINFNILDLNETEDMIEKWIPHPKGGHYRKWYGNLEYVVNFKNRGEDLYNYEGTSIIKNPEFYFKEGISWSHTSTKSFGARYLPKGTIFNVEAPSLYPKDISNLKYLLGLFNTKVLDKLFKVISQSLHYLAGDMAKLPIVITQNSYTRDIIDKLVTESINLSKFDWDSFETSWDFQTHPFLTHKGATLEESYKNWEEFAYSQFAQLKSNEEELNRIFIDIYGLQDELNPEVKDDNVTLRKAKLERDIKSFISYAVGCMFGRYSIDKPGLILANAGETVTDYQAKVPNSRFEIDDDNIIPVLDDDYFHDDIVSRFREFLKAVYGKETLEQNMSFIAHALSPESKATPDKVLRDYFLKDFYADHLKVYQKRPIYWMFTSGKQQGFNALIYMHRYNKDTLGKIWGDYLRELEAKLDAEIALLEKADKKNTAQFEKLKKQRVELKEYDADLDIVASEKIEIDLDDGVAINYAKFGKLVRPLK